MSGYSSLEEIKIIGRCVRRLLIYDTYFLRLIKITFDVFILFQVGTFCILLVPSIFEQNWVIFLGPRYSKTWIFQEGVIRIVCALLHSLRSLCSLRLLWSFLNAMERRERLEHGRIESIFFDFTFVTKKWALECARDVSTVVMGGIHYDCGIFEVPL